MLSISPLLGCSIDFLTIIAGIDVSKFDVIIRLDSPVEVEYY